MAPTHTVPSQTCTKLRIALSCVGWSSCCCEIQRREPCSEFILTPRLFPESSSFRLPASAVHHAYRLDSFSSWLFNPCEFPASDMLLLPKKTHPDLHNLVWSLENVVSRLLSLWVFHPIGFCKRGHLNDILTFLLIRASADFFSRCANIHESTSSICARPHHSLEPRASAWPLSYCYARSFSRLNQESPRCTFHTVAVAIDTPRWIPEPSAWHLSCCLFVRLPPPLRSFQPSCVFQGC